MSENVGPMAVVEMAEPVATEATAMEDLSDEHLLQIFGRIDDGVALLDGVALVSRRWHRLSKDSRAWDGAMARIGAWWTDDGSPRPAYVDDDEGPEAWTRPLRVLLRAPALRRIVLAWPCFWTPPAGDRLTRVASALRRCDAPVRELVLARGFSVHCLGSGIVLESILSVLWRNRHMLRALSIGICHDAQGDFEALGVRYTLFDLLRRLPLVRDLTFHTSYNYSASPAVGAAAALVAAAAAADVAPSHASPLPGSSTATAMTPRLRRCEISTNVVPWMAAASALVADLFLAGASSLRWLSILSPTGETALPEQVAERLERCAALRVLEIPVSQVRCVVRDEMPLLHTLSLFVGVGVHRLRPDVVTRWVEAISTSSVLHGVERLALRPMFHAAGTGTPKRKAVNVEVQRLLLAVVAACTGAHDMRVLMLARRREAAPVLEALVAVWLQLPKLKSIGYSGPALTAEQVARLAATGRLRALKVDFKCGTGTEGTPSTPHVHDDEACDRVAAELVRPLGAGAVVDLRCMDRPGHKSLKDGPAVLKQLLMQLQMQQQHRRGTNSPPHGDDFVLI